jgi:SIR2-like domain
MLNDAVKELAYLFRATRENRPLLLLGGGASYRSGIPLAAEAVKQIAKAAYARQIKGVDWRFISLTPSDWMPFLHQQPWFISDPKSLAENFPLAVQHLLYPSEFRREFFTEMIRPPNGINSGYRHLASLVMRRLCSTVLTVNFDHLIVDAYRERSPHIPEIIEINRTKDDLVRFKAHNRCQVVYLHGAIEYYRDKNLVEETQKLDENLVQRIRPLLNESPLVVIGYRGYEHSVMRHLLEEGIDESGGYRQGIYWCIRHGEDPHENVLRLKNLLGPNLQLIRIEGFDELMEELDIELKDEAWPGSAVNLVGPATPKESISLEFDHQPMDGVTLDDLDHDLILATLRKYCERLKLPPIDQQNYLAWMEEQGLLITVDKAFVPTKGCYLLFGHNIVDFFPYARVSVTRDNKKRTVFSGNLITQLQELESYLTSSEVNPILRIKSERGAVEQSAYPPRALLELTVNLLVHRDYNFPGYSTIEFKPGQYLRFTNPGGLMPNLYRHVKPSHDGLFTPIRSASEIRNSSLADVFFGIDSMDKAGSGLPDVQEMMVEYGGRAQFAVGENNQSVCATLYQPRQGDPDKSRVARRVSPTELYITNLLPFRLVPKCIYILPLRETPLVHLPLFEQGEVPSELPIFIKHGERLFSFADLNLFPEFAERRGYLEKIRNPLIEEFIDDEDQRRLFVWLVRKHWDFFLHKFGDKGFFIEPKKNRGFFQLIKGERNRIVYDSRSRRNVSRDVVKQRGEGERIWYENEGIYYEVVEFGGQWAMQLKPFYMFTKADGRTPLPSFARTRRATRRMKFDRNKNVDDDLTFWARLLSGGQPTINIGNIGVDSLILSPEYCSTEVPIYNREAINDENAN